MAHWVPFKNELSQGSKRSSLMSLAYSNNSCIAEKSVFVISCTLCCFQGIARLGKCNLTADTVQTIFLSRIFDSYHKANSSLKALDLVSHQFGIIIIMQTVQILQLWAWNSHLAQDVQMTTSNQHFVPCSKNVMWELFNLSFKNS